MTGGGYAHLQKRMSRLLEGYADADRRRIRSAVSVLSIFAVLSIRTVSSRGRIIRVHRAGRTAGAVQSIRTIQSAHARAAGEIGVESDIVANGNVEFGMQVWLAEDGNDDMSDFAKAGSGIFRKRQNPALVGENHGCSDLQILPHHLARALPFGEQYLAVRLGERHN